MAVVATTTFAILSRQPAKDVVDESPLATVLISKGDIRMDQSLDPLIEGGVIIEIEVPRAALVVGVFTDIDQLRGTAAISLIRRHEQISANHVMQLSNPA